MSHIVLTQEQVQVVTQASESVEVRDPEGRTLAFLTVLSPLDAEVIRLHKQRRHLPQQPGIPAAQVQAHFRRLEEIRQAEGMDRAKMHELLRRMQAGEQV
jgi:hypothetical protein